MKTVYMDHAATTAVRPEVVDAMQPYFHQTFGNPSSMYGVGREARAGLDEARQATADILGADFSEVIFTASGSESDNLGIKGAAWARRRQGKHLITSTIEHHAVLDSFRWLETQGFSVSYIPVNADGIIDVDALEASITDETTLISIMYANNEIGTIQPIGKIGDIARKRGVLFHTDAVQAPGLLPIDVGELHVDMLTLSAHKFYGPKGVGVLYVKKGVKLEPLIHGGGQEKNRRAGTENIAGIVGLATALRLADAEREETSGRLAVLRNRLVDGIRSLPDARINGSLTERLPNNVNACFEYIEGESLLLNLDLQGVAASSGSACTSGSLDPSHVLLALGLTHEVAQGSLRFSLGRENTEADVNHVLDVLPAIVHRLRQMSPLL